MTNATNGRIIKTSRANGTRKTIAPRTANAIPGEDIRHNNGLDDVDAIVESLRAEYGNVIVIGRDEWTSKITSMEDAEIVAGINCMWCGGDVYTVIVAPVEQQVEQQVEQLVEQLVINPEYADMTAREFRAAEVSYDNLHNEGYSDGNYNPYRDNLYVPTPTPTPTPTPYTITADHEIGDPDYHCATLTIDDQWYAYSHGGIDAAEIDIGTLTLGKAYDAGILDYDDDPDNIDRDCIITEIDDLREDIRDEILDAAKKAADDYADAEIAAKAEDAAEGIDGYVKFLWWSPRGFANECTLYGIKADEVDEAEAWLDDQDPAQCKWEWMDAEEARDELRDGVENAINLLRGFGADNPPCGVTSIAPWRERNA